MNKMKQKTTDWVNFRKNNIGRVSANVSNILRQLVLAGVGIVWLFKVIGKDGTIQIDNHLLFALGAFVLSIVIELFHYIVEIFLNAYYLTDKKKNIEMPTYVSGISWFLWGLKLILVLFAYVLIGVFLCGRISL